MKRVLFAIGLLAAMTGSALAQKNAATCATFPCVVATINMPNQGTGVSQQVVYTPIVSGMYRVSLENGDVGAMTLRDRRRSHSLKTFDHGFHGFHGLKNSGCRIICNPRNP